MRRLAARRIFQVGSLKFGAGDLPRWLRYPGTCAGPPGAVHTTSLGNTFISAQLLFRHPCRRQCATHWSGKGHALPQHREQLVREREVRRRTLAIHVGGDPSRQYRVLRYFSPSPWQQEDTERECES